MYIYPYKMAQADQRTSLPNVSSINIQRRQLQASKGEKEAEKSTKINKINKNLAMQSKMSNIVHPLR